MEETIKKIKELLGYTSIKIHNNNNNYQYIIDIGDECIEQKEIINFNKISDSWYIYSNELIFEIKKSTKK